MNNDKQNDATEITFPENGVFTNINYLGESVPDEEFNNYYNHSTIQR